jgi:predicted TIM-barrel fold metal-dependent hydrolase
MARHGPPTRAARSIQVAAKAAVGQGFREGFATLEVLGLTFDAWLFQTQLKDLVDLARAFPQTTIVLNHVGGPLATGLYAGKREGTFTEWRDGIRAVAGLPKTYIKLGGLGMKLVGFTFYENDQPPSSEDLAQAWHPHIETCIEAFGPRLSMFESNFPVDKGMSAQDRNVTRRAK